MARVYRNSKDLVKAVARETKVKPDDVRKVLKASFSSTKSYILKEYIKADALIRNKACGDVAI